MAAASGAAIVAPVTLRIIPVTPVLTSVTPAEFDVAHFDSLNPPSTLPTVTLTISGTGFVSGATAWVTAFIPQNTQSYPTTLIDSNTLQVALPLSLQGGPITLTVTNPGTPQSNALSLLEGKPAISASGVTGIVAPGQTIAINVFNLGPVVPMMASASGPAVTTLGPTQVLFDGVPAQVLLTYFMQVRVVVPAGVAGEAATKIVVKYLDQSSQPLTVPTAGNQAPPPQLGPGVSGVLNPDGSLNSATNPASAGAVVKVLIDMSQAPLNSAPAAATIGGVSAPIVPMTGFIIGVPGKIMFQVQVPAGVQPGSAVPLVVAFQNTSATVSVPIAIQ